MFEQFKKFMFFLLCTFITLVFATYIAMPMLHEISTQSQFINWSALFSAGVRLLLMFVIFIFGVVYTLKHAKQVLIPPVLIPPKE